MSENGWALEGIEGKSAYFKRIDPIRQCYYCYLLDSADKGSPKQIEDILSLEWTFVVSAEDVSIFTSDSERPRLRVQNSADAEQERMKIFSRLKPKNRFDYPAMGFGLGNVFRPIFNGDRFMQSKDIVYGMLIVMVSLAFIAIDWRYGVNEENVINKLGQGEANIKYAEYKLIVKGRKIRFFAAILCYCLAIVIMFLGPSVSGLLALIQRV
jgi:hypothetical protein